MQNAKCKGQNKGKDAMACGHPSILQFEAFNLHFALAAARGRAVQGRTR
jgi:hypothetical protein